jgi:hypothetical protein
MESCAPSDTSTDLPFDIQKARPSVQKHYIEMISHGVAPRLAEMLALQQPPGVRGTDRALMEGRLNNEQFDRMPKDHAQKMLAAAKKAGISTSGKYYSAGLADKRGPADPAAWVDSVHDIKRVAMQRNLSVSGAVEHKGIPMPRPKSKPLSERLTREMMKVEAKRRPTMKQGELREYVIDRYGRKPKD